MFVKLCHLDLRTLGVLGDVEGEQLDVLGDGGAGGGPRRQVVRGARHAPGGQTRNLRLRVLHGVNILRQRLGRRLLGVRSLNKREQLLFSPGHIIDFPPCCKQPRMSTRRLHTFGKIQKMIYMP